MKIADVRKMKRPLDRLVYWINERESIRLKKESDESAPWTDDEILQRYRFCNVRRMDDKVSRWLMTNWYEPYKDHRNILAAVSLARFVNKPESLNVVTNSLFRDERPNWEKVKACLRLIKKHGKSVVFNGAYMVRGNSNKSPDKIGTVVDEYVRPMVDCVIVNNHSMETTWELIESQYGFGSFMAGQVVADLRWAVSGPWNDRNSWVPLGPGSNRGMNRLKGRPLEYQTKSDQFVNELFGLISNLKSVIPFSGRLEAMDWQNCLCEFDKYERTLLEDRRPKQLYRSGS